MNTSLQQFIRQFSQVFTAPLFELGEETISLVWLLKFLFFLLLVMFVAGMSKRFLKYRLLGRLGIDPGNREAIATLVSYGLGAIGYIIVLQTSGFDLATFAVIAGGLGVGIGFGLQDITKNLVSGLTLLLERKLKVGDFIQFDEIYGYIDEISIRTTVIRTLAGEEVIIPNSKLVETKVINKSYQSFTARMTIPVSVAYESDPVLVTEVLLNSAYTEAEVLDEPPPKVIFKGFGDSALEFELWAWVRQIDREIIIKSNLNFIIEYNLRQADISIPFPQQDIWVKNIKQLDVEPQTDNGSSPKLQAASRLLSLRDLLRQVTYFENLNDLHLRSLIEMGYRKQLEPDEILFHQGDPGTAFCIVLSGAIEAYYKGEETQTPLFTFSARQFFGELPLMLGVPYPTTMKAATETILFIISSQGFGRLLHTYPELAEEIAQALAQRQEVLEEHRKQLQLTLASNPESDNSPVAWIHKRLRQLFNTGSRSL